MSNKLIQNGSNVEVIFTLRNESGEVIYGDEGKKIKLILDSKTQIFDIFKCIVGKEEGYSGKFKINKSDFLNEIEFISTESLPSYLVFKKETIIQLGSNNNKFGFIKDIQDKCIVVETSRPFKNITSILDVKVLKVD